MLPNGSDLRENQFAMRLSLVTGVFMLVAKVGAYVYTGSAAILSDAAESVVHVVAVAFAAFSLWLASRPANRRYQYGYERVSFFSAGFEGALIVLAAVLIIVAAIQKWLAGPKLEHLGAGTLVVLAAAMINAGLGWYLVSRGKKTHSIILEANGKHVLTDSWTSFGVVGGLGLVMLTGWLPFDPILAIAVALNILWSGGDLMRRSVTGLMDYSDPATAQAIENEVQSLAAAGGFEYHELRFRDTGQRLMVEMHLLFPYAMPVGEAHRLATEFERTLPKRCSRPVDVITHLEAVEDHARVHDVERSAGA